MEVYIIIKNIMQTYTIMFIRNIQNKADIYGSLFLMAYCGQGCAVIVYAAKSTAQYYTFIYVILWLGHMFGNISKVTLSLSYYTYSVLDSEVNINNKSMRVHNHIRLFIFLSLYDFFSFEILCGWTLK